MSVGCRFVVFSTKSVNLGSTIEQPANPLIVFRAGFMACFLKFVAQQTQIKGSLLPLTRAEIRLGVRVLWLKKWCTKELFRPNYIYQVTTVIFVVY